MEPVIQNQLRLSSFKIVKVDFDSGDNADKSSLGDLKIDLGIKSEIPVDNKNTFLLKFKVELESADTKFNLKIFTVSTFESREVYPDNFVDSGFAKVNAPAIVFPSLEALLILLPVLLELVR